MTHVGRGVDDCAADLQVPVYLGFLIEGLLTCACRIVSRTLGEIEPKFASAIDSFFATSMVVLGMFIYKFFNEKFIKELQQFSEQYCRFFSVITMFTHFTEEVLTP